jgi:hypothetical protein
VAGPESFLIGTILRAMRGMSARSFLASGTGLEVIAD